MPVGTREIQFKQSEIKVYPNPLQNGNLFIKSSKGEIDQIMIFNSLGQKILQAHPNKNTVQVSRDELKGSGLFFIEISSNASKTIEKLVVK